MTFLTKPSLVVKKAPLIEAKCDEEVIEVHPSTPYWSSESRLSLSTLLCMTLAAFFVTLVGITTGFMLYRQYVRGTNMHRYQGFCTIPITMRDANAYESNYHVMPLRWSTGRAGGAGGADGADGAEPPAPADEPRALAEDFLHELQEELDIKDAVERISVLDNGRRVSFVHDFDANITGIVDSERCFTMELDPRTTLAPEVFVMSIESGAQFDISRVRASLRAVLPALPRRALASPELALRCEGRPVYSLLRGEDLVVRKRSVDEPGHDYMQFSGRHVLEIDILNLAALLQHEQAAQ